MRDANLFTALRAAFPVALDGTAIETADTPVPLHYTWRDLERGTAMLANLLQSLGLPPASRIAVQTEKSVEALMLYLAVLRAGHVFLPLNTAYQAAEIAYFIGNAEPAVVVCAGKNFGWVSKIAFVAGTQHVFTLNDDRTGTLLDRAAFHSDQHQPVQRGADDLAAILYTSGTTGRSKGAMLTHGNLLSNAQVLKDAWGWQAEIDAGWCTRCPSSTCTACSWPRTARCSRAPRCCGSAASTRAPRWPGCPRRRCSWACRRCMCGCWARPGSRARPAATCGSSSAARRRC
jgi:malonyl-CoA/methylmalonyl-CoA synthetase